MGEKVKYYDPQDFNTWKGQRRINFKPPRPNFLSAAIYIRKFFDGNGFDYAAMGGLAMLCLGSRRDMIDIHIMYEDRDFQQIKIKLEADRRVRLPKGMNSLFPTKVLLRTGPSFKDGGCTENVDVEVNLIPPGFCGSPSTDNLRNHQCLLHFNWNGKAHNLKGLSTLYQLKTLLALCRSHDLAWDPKEDIVFLCQTYSKEVDAVRSQLNPKELQGHFFSTSYFCKLQKEDQRRCSMALLGKYVIGVPAPPKVFNMPPVAPFQNQSPPHKLQKTRPQEKHGYPTRSVPRRPVLAQSSVPPNTVPDYRTHTPASASQLLAAPSRTATHYRAVSAPDISSQSQKPFLRTPPPRNPRPTSHFIPPVIHSIQNVSRPQIVHGPATPPMTATITGVPLRKLMPKLDTSIAERSTQDEISQQSYFRNGPVQPSQKVWRSPAVQSRFPLEQPEHFPCMDTMDMEHTGLQNAGLTVVGPEGLYNSPHQRPSPPSQPISVSSQSRLSNPPLGPSATEMAATFLSSFNAAPPPQSHAHCQETTDARIHPATAATPQKTTLTRSNAHRQSIHPKPADHPTPESTENTSPSPADRPATPTPVPTSPTHQQPLIASITAAIDETLASLPPIDSENTTNPSSPDTIPSPPHITEQVQKFYRLSYKSPVGTVKRKLMWPQPKVLVTGYEAFCHGPYSAVDESPKDCERNPFARFSYTSTPVSALTDGGYDGGVGGGVCEKRHQRVDSQQAVC